MRTIIFCLLLAHSMCSIAQKAQQAIETLYKKFPQEKIVLSFSKNDYIAGEAILFKAYALTAYEPSEISTNIYVELYDKTKQTIARQIVPLFRGSGDGGFVLPVSLAEDVYYVRAYTSYMLNFDEALQYVKPISIYNPASMNKLVKKPVQWTATAFVEGGRLLHDVPTAAAIRLFSTGTLPTNWKGSLFEKGSNDVIANIEALNSEVGIVRFIPSVGKEYIATIKDSSGNVQTVDLPKVVERGTSLQVRVLDDKIEYAIYTQKLPANSMGYKLIGTIHDQVVFAGTIKRSVDVASGKIDIAGMPAGVLRLTLFDENENAVNERLCFVHQPLKPVTPAFTIDTLSFGEKRLNSWRLELDSVSWPTYSVQVSDADYPVSHNFLSDVYLSSDFISPIHNASWYLQEVTDKKKSALDALLITEKWSRFSWDDLLNDRFPSIKYFPEKYLSYTASVRKGKKPEPLRSMNLVFQAKDSSVQFVQVKTDSAGNFKMNDIVFADTMKVYYQASNRKFLERDVLIDFKMENKFHPYHKALPVSSFETALRTKTDTLPSHIKWTIAQKSHELVASEKGKMMDEVVIRTRAKSATEELDQKLSSAYFSADNAIIFDFVNEDQTSAMSYTNILEWLQGRVPGYRTELDQEGQMLPILRGGVAEIYIDEMPIGQEVLKDALNALPVSSIAMIKIIRGISLASRGGNGAIAIYTKRGGMESKFSPPSLANNILVGYAQLPLLFSPDYREDFVRRNRDEREILFRGTMLYPGDVNSKATLKFYNSDKAKKYRLMVTGFTSDGRVVYLNKIIE